MRRAGVLLIIMCTLLSGCAAGGQGREPENTVLAQVLGIDRVAGGFLLTAAGTGGQEECLRQSVWAGSLAEGLAALPQSGERWVSLTNVTHFLLGDGVEPGEVLAVIFGESGMSWRANVWSVPIAAALMEEVEDGGVARLTVLEQGGAATLSVLEALAGLSAGGSAALPALTVTGGRLEVAGTVRYETVPGAAQDPRAQARRGLCGYRPVGLREGFEVIT